MLTNTYRNGHISKHSSNNYWYFLNRSSSPTPTTLMVYAFNFWPSLMHLWGVKHWSFFGGYKSFSTKGKTFKLIRDKDTPFGYDDTNFQTSTLTVGVLRVFPPGGWLRGGVVPPPPGISGSALLLGLKFYPRLQDHNSSSNMQFHGHTMFPQNSRGC